MDELTSVMVSDEMRSEGASIEYEAPPRTKAAAPVLPRSATRTAVASDEATDEQNNGGKRKYPRNDKTTRQRQAAAKKSTGPKTPEGKATSSRNAVRHAMTAFQASILVKGEDAAAYQELHAALRREHPPLDATGDFAIGELANAMWRQSRRINLAESALIKREQDHTGFFSRVTFSMGQGPYGHLLATADGVATLRTMVASTTAIIPASIEETDEEFWQSFRRGARDLASAVPEFGKLVNEDATDETLMASLSCGR